MPKPIFIVTVPSYLTPDEANKKFDNFTKSLKDYHVIFVRGESGNYTFECFYEKDFTHINFEELKEIINNKTK